MFSGWAGALTMVCPRLQGHLGFYITDLSTNGVHCSSRVPVLDPTLKASLSLL